jgi:hypothetical protein
MRAARQADARVAHRSQPSGPTPSRASSRRLLLPQKHRGQRVVARADRSKLYRRTLPIHLAPGPHHVYARVYYKRPGSKKLRRKTVVRRFTVCAWFRFGLGGRSLTGERPRRLGRSGFDATAATRAGFSRGV